MRYISTVDTAKLVREALRAAFPGVKFSVRKSTGTASAWLGVTYSDGPTWSAVNALVGRFEGRSFDGSTDSYNENDTTLVAGTGAELPEEVRYSCDGINVSRNLTPAAYAVADVLISAETGRDFSSLTADGVPDWRSRLPLDFPCACNYRCDSPAMHAGSVLIGLDLGAAAVAR